MIWKRGLGKGAKSSLGVSSRFGNWGAKGSLGTCSSRFGNWGAKVLLGFVPGSRKEKKSLIEVISRFGKGKKKLS